MVSKELEEYPSPWNPIWVIGKDLSISWDAVNMVIDEKTPRAFFVSPNFDPFGRYVPYNIIDDIFEAMERSQQHYFFLATREPYFLINYLSSRYSQGVQDTREYSCQKDAATCIEKPKDKLKLLPNIWFGVKFTNQLEASRKLPYLSYILSDNKFADIDPIMGPIDLIEVGPDQENFLATVGITPGPYGEGVEYPMEPQLKFVICRGGTGIDAQPAHPSWVKHLAKQCNHVEVPFYFEGWGDWGNDWKPGTIVNLNNLSPNQKVAKGDNGGHIVFSRIGASRSGRLIDGKEWLQLPKVVNLND